MLLTVRTVRLALFARANLAGAPHAVAEWGERPAYAVAADADCRQFLSTMDAIYHDGTLLCHASSELKGAT